MFKETYKLGSPKILRSQKEFDALSPEQKASGWYAVENAESVETWNGAVELARKDGVRCTCLTPYIAQYHSQNHTSDT